MKPVLVLTHGYDIPAGYLGDVLADAAIPAETVPLDAGATIPDHVDWSAAVSLGGLMGAYEEERYPYLREEKRYLRDAVAGDMPVLGICLGCQLLADTLGGRAYRAPESEVAVDTVSLTPLGVEDPVVAALNGPTLIWHQDTWELPPDADLLAETDRCPQAFRKGSALGIQPHPEASPEIVKGWIDHGGREWLAERGYDADELLGAVESTRDTSERVGRAVFEAWVREALSS